MNEPKHTPGPWLVFNVGCIECGVSSNVVGVFQTEDEAYRIADICRRDLGWREGGQNAFDVYDLSEPMSEEYIAAIAKAEGVQP